MIIPQEVKDDLLGMVEDGEINLADQTADEISSKMAEYGYMQTADWVDKNAKEFDEHLEATWGQL